MINIVSIVEGDGEVAALPVLLRRLNDWLSPGTLINVSHPIRVKRDQFLNKDEEFVKKLRTAAGMCGETGWILVLLDADDDCPKELAHRIQEKAENLAPGLAVSVVLANREYEAWFIAAARSLDGRRGFVFKGQAPDAESIRGAKQWISKQVPKGAYHPVLDQPGFSAVMDLQQAYDNSRSFRKLCEDWQTRIAATADL